MFIQPSRVMIDLYLVASSCVLIICHGAMVVDSTDDVSSKDIYEALNGSLLSCIRCMIDSLSISNW